MQEELKPAKKNDKNAYVSVVLPLDIHRKAKILASIDGLHLGRFVGNLVINKVNSIDFSQFKIE